MDKSSQIMLNGVEKGLVSPSIQKREFSNSFLTSFTFPKSNTFSALTLCCSKAKLNDVYSKGVLKCRFKGVLTLVNSDLTPAHLVFVSHGSSKIVVTLHNLHY